MFVFGKLTITCQVNRRRYDSNDEIMKRMVLYIPIPTPQPVKIGWEVAEERKRKMTGGGEVFIPRKKGSEVNTHMVKDH